MEFGVPGLRVENHFLPHLPISAMVPRLGCCQVLRLACSALYWSLFLLLGPLLLRSFHLFLSVVTSFFTAVPSLLP